MAHHLKELQRKVRYSTGSCSIVIVIDFEQGNFCLEDERYVDHTNSQEIAEMYRQAIVYAEQLLNQK